MNVFDVPIIAQWIRVNPTRWRDRISLRTELYGCNYDSLNLYFNGSSLVKLDLMRDPISASRETLRFRFKTSHPNGVLVYSRGTQGDYIVVQLKENRLVLNVNLGSNIATTLQVGSLLDDNIWHDVIISRNRRDIIFSVDRVVVQGRVKGEFDRLNLNRAVGIFVFLFFVLRSRKHYLCFAVLCWWSPEYSRRNYCTAKLYGLS